MKQPPYPYRLLRSCWLHALSSWPPLSMGKPLVIMATVLASDDCQRCRYEGTGRSLSLKLIEQLRRQSAVGGSSGKICKK